MTLSGSSLRKARAASAALAFLLFAPFAGGHRLDGVPDSSWSAAAQEIDLPHVEPSHRAKLFVRVKREVEEALLTPQDDVRDGRLRAAEQIARYLVDSDSTDAEAFYWLAVAQGIRTEHSGPFQKLTSGKEVFFTTRQILDLDPLHAGGHEMMGRLHAAVMRLPWPVRVLALRMGMGDALGDASWEQAEWHYMRAMGLDSAAVAPRLELAKLYLGRERAAEAVPVLRALLEMRPADRLEAGMLREARTLIAGVTGS